MEQKQSFEQRVTENCIDVKKTNTQTERKQSNKESKKLSLLVFLHVAIGQILSCTF